MFIFNAVGMTITDCSVRAPDKADVENIPTLLPFGDTDC